MLFEKFSVRSLQLANHMAMASLTRSRATPDRTPNAVKAAYYGQRETAGLIISEGTSPSPNGLGYPRIPELCDKVSKRKDGQAEGAYTREFKMEAVRLVNGGQSVPETTKAVAVPVPVRNPGKRVRLSDKGERKGAGDVPASAESMELARLRVQLAFVTMERDILKKAKAYFAKETL